MDRLAKSLGAGLIASVATVEMALFDSPTLSLARGGKAEAFLSGLFSFLFHDLDI